jgi:HEAT repeat protein
VDLLISAVAEEQSGQHGWAITALGETGNPRAIQHLIPCLEAEQEPVRFRAAMALGKLGCENATPLLIRYALEEGERWREAVDVLRELDQEVAREVLHERLKGRYDLRSEIQMLAEMGDTTVVPRLIEILQSEPQDSRFPLVRMLAVVAGVAPLAQVLVAERVERYSRETYREARKALRKLTGQNIESYEEWRTWYEAHPVSPSQE